jgi:SAM-dependent methyltransferase
MYNTSQKNESRDYLPTYKRYKYLSKRVMHCSLIRALQNEILENHPISGKVLDFGGGEKSAYRHLLQCSSYHSVNIDPDIEPTWNIEVGEILPCDNDSFDTVISLNTLEHIYDAIAVLKELHRVLRPNGELAIITPFLVPVHGHPNDFFRPTSSWYFHSLEKLGFSSIEVTPLSWGPYSTIAYLRDTAAAMCKQRDLLWPVKKLRNRFALFLDLLYSILSSQQLKDVDERYISKFPLAFFVKAHK